MFIDIPNVPGVPPLSSYASSPVALLVSDVLVLLGALFGPQWGIFLDGSPALIFNSFVTFEYRQDWSIADYQVEDGGFENYDKVQHPFDVKVRLASGGSSSDRQDLLDSVDDIANTLDLFDVVTPERTYSNCCVTHYDVQRTSDHGVGMVVVEVWFQEVRQTATATYTNTQQPGAAGNQSSGNVAASTPNAQVQQTFNAMNIGGGGN